MVNHPNRSQKSEPRKALEAVIADLGLSVAAVFVPLSQSRNKGEKYPTLNWRVTLRRARLLPPEAGVDLFDVLTTDYSAGSAHCPSYRQGHRTVFTSERIAFECEHGKRARWLESAGMLTGGEPIKLDAVDVIHSLALNADVLNHSSFEEWASDLGHDPDSRAAENIYRQCLEHALALRNAIGEDGLRRLQEAGQGY